MTAMSYDAVGNVAQVVKPSGTATVGDPTDGTVSYSYDASNRPVTSKWPGDIARQQAQVDILRGILGSRE